MIFSKINLMQYSPFSVSSCAKRPRAACSFSGGARGQGGCFVRHFPTLTPEHYTYKTITMQNLKSTDSPKKSTENILSVDFKSTDKLHKTSQTRCRLTSLSKKPKKINLDQL